MDVRAFLRPGANLATKITAETDSGHLSTPGRLIEHQGRLTWLSSAPYPLGQVVTLTLDLPGYVLTKSGDLQPTLGDESAAVVLLGQIKKCRPLRFQATCILHLNLLGRVCPAF